MSAREQISPLPWSYKWHTTGKHVHGDFTIHDANGRAIFFEGNGCSPLDPEFLCEAVNYYAWAKGQLEMLGIRPSPQASEAQE